uniref:Replication factor A C-terminal domain-containing protein n=1 Tax=Lactuca sativa TaxID=4236 RepID=A0A9R1W157_LACSA|nr:hypothetical protein LSAT_V11C300111980 [Lactuca sativa]
MNNTEKNQYPNSINIWLHDKTFLIKASIMDIQFQNNWYQVLCPTCRDPIHKRGPQWYYIVHSLIKNPKFSHKFSLTLSDTTNTISTIISNTLCQKLLNSTLQNLIANNNTIDRKTLPPFIAQQKGRSKNMSVQILKASDRDNLRFIIVDIESLNSILQKNVPTTPTHVPTTRSTMQQNTHESTMSVTRSTRTLLYNTTSIHINQIITYHTFMFSNTSSMLDTDEPTPSMDTKRSRKK